MVQTQEVNFEDAVDWRAQYTAAEKALRSVLTEYGTAKMQVALLEGELNKISEAFRSERTELMNMRNSLREVQQERDGLIDKLRLVSGDVVDTIGAAGMEELDRETAEVLHEYSFFYEDEDDDGVKGYDDE